jgi:hypothetical protein
VGLEGQQENGSEEEERPHGWMSPEDGRARAECVGSEESAVFVRLLREGVETVLKSDKGCTHGGGGIALTVSLLCLCS